MQSKKHLRSSFLITKNISCIGLLTTFSIIHSIEGCRGVCYTMWGEYVLIPAHLCPLPKIIYCKQQNESDNYQYRPSSEPSLPPLFHPHNPPTVIQPCHIKSSMGHTINSATSTCSRDSTLNSSVSSNVNSLTRDGSCFTPTTKPTIHIPGPYNQSRDSRVSSLTTSSTVSGALSIVPTSNAQHDIPTPKSNLTSYDMVGILNGKSPDLLYLPSDFLPTNKKHINEIHGRKFWTYAVHFDRSLPEENPDESQLASFLTKLNSFYEEIHDNLTKCLLSHLMVGSLLK